MLGFGAFGQFAIAQASVQDVVSATFILDDSATPERRKKRRKQQEDAVDEINKGREQIRGAIYDAIHPPEILEPLSFNPGLLASPSYPIISPTDPMVRSIMAAHMGEKQRQKMLADIQDEDDIEILLKGGR